MQATEWGVGVSHEMIYLRERQTFESCMYDLCEGRSVIPTATGPGYLREFNDTPIE